MAREIVFTILLLMVCGPLSSTVGLLNPTAAQDDSALAQERRCWIRIWLPLIPASFMSMLLFGWVLQETQIADENVHPLGIIVALFFGLVWVRAIARATWAALERRHPLPAETRGLLQPRISISPALLNELDREALEATHAHEQAHVRHRDPLRILLAQIATDLQFPASAARVRFKEWINALEMARDEEARRMGADGLALAEAILTAARMARPVSYARAATASEGDGLRSRIARLLLPLQEAASPSRSVAKHLVRTAFTSLHAGGIAIGIFCGDAVVRAIPGVVLFLD